MEDMEIEDSSMKMELQSMLLKKPQDLLGLKRRCSMSPTRYILPCFHCNPSTIKCIRNDQFPILMQVLFYFIVHHSIRIQKAQ